MLALLKSNNRMVKEWFFDENDKQLRYAWIDYNSHKNEYMLNTQYADKTLLKLRITDFEAQLMIRAEDNAIIDYLYC